MLKYTIKYQLFDLADRKNKVIKAILLKSGFARTTFYRYWNLRKGAKESIPADLLRIIAQELGCTMEELYNE